MPRIFLDDDKRWQLLIAAMNGAQQCHSMAIFTKSHDSEIQLAPSLTGNLQCLRDGSGDQENGIGAAKGLSYHRFEFGVGCEDKC